MFNNYQKMIEEGMGKIKYDEKMLSILKATLETGKKIFVAGNGGSAAIANHFACDFSKGATNDWNKNFKRYKVICLSSNTGYITAISNDEHYDEVFKQQLINLGEKGDVLVLISSSGNSPNIVKAAEYAKENGITVIGLCGFSGGKLKELADYVAHVPVDSYEVCEDVHNIFGHYLTRSMRGCE